MGSALGTSGLAFVAAIIIAVVAILLIFIDSDVRSIPGYENNDSLKIAHTDLIYAQIFAWIATAFTLLLALGYLLTNAEWLQNEWVHLIAILVATGTMIASIIYMAFAVKRVHPADNDQGSEGLLWTSMIMTTIAIIIIVVMAIWRLYHKSAYKTTEDKIPTTTTQPQYYDQEGYPIDPKTGKRVRYVETTQHTTVYEDPHAHIKTHVAEIPTSETVPQSFMQV